MANNSRMAYCFSIFSAALFLGLTTTVSAFDVDAGKAFYQQIANQQNDVKCLQESNLEACVRLSKTPSSLHDRANEKIVEIIKSRPSIPSLEFIIGEHVFLTSYMEGKLARDTLKGLYRAEGRAKKQSVYFFKSYKISQNIADLKEMIAYADADELLGYHEGEFSNSAEFKQISLNKLHALNDPKSAFHAYLIGKDKADFNRAFSTVRAADSSTANRIFSEKFMSTIKSVAQLPDFFTSLANCTLCDLPYFYNLSKSLADFGKNLDFDGFVSSIEYRYVLRHEPIKVSYEQDGSDFVMTISYADGKLKKTSSAKCQRAGTDSRTIPVGFFEGFLAPSSTKTVVYELSDCRPQSEDMRRLASLERRLTGETKSSSAFEAQGAWSHRVAVSSSYDSTSSGGSSNGGLGNVCASINDMSLKTYCNTGDCNSLGFNYPEHQALCTHKNSNSLYKTKLHTAIKNYINYGQCDTFQLREKAGLSQTTVNSFCRVKDSPSLRTMMAIMWLNGITFRY